jgi:glycosyltransferase involved in cell wall biosynthesis
LTEIPAPYRIPLFNALARTDGVDLRVLFLSNRDPRRSYPVYEREFAFDRHVLRGHELVRGGRWTVVSRGVLAELRRFRPHVIAVGGWNQPAFWQAQLYARACGLPVLLWIESTARDARSGSRGLERARRAAVRLSAGAFVPGRAAADYAASLGLPADRIAVAPNATDLEIFGSRVAAERSGRDELRARHGIDGCCTLSVGRLSREKGPDVLVRAFAHDVPGTLVLIGDGPQEAELRRLLEARDGPAPVPERVLLVGRRERDELPPWYAAADVFCLPSRSDTWGMVLSEAAAAGLPLVATEAAGAGHDLIEEGVNGYRVPVEDERALAEALRRAADDPAWRSRAGLRSRELVAEHTPEAWASAVAGLARQVASGRAAG